MSQTAAQQTTPTNGKSANFAEGVFINYFDKTTFYNIQKDRFQAWFDKLPVTSDGWVYLYSRPQKNNEQKGSMMENVRENRFNNPQAQSDPAATNTDSGLPF